MACKIEVRKKIEEVIERVAEPSFNAFTRQEARQRSRDVNNLYPKMTIVEEGRNGYYKITPLWKNLNEIIDVEFNRQIEFENNELFKELEKNLETSVEYFNSIGDVFYTYEDMEASEESLDDMYENGTITSYCS